MIAILMMVAKLAAPDFLKINIFWKNIYDVTIWLITSSTKFYHATQIEFEMWWCEQSFGNSSFSMKKL